MHLHIITTGGSIDKHYSTAHSDFIVGEPQVISILQNANPGIQVTIASLAAKDSLALTDSDRERIVRYIEKSSYTRFIITHGTDTMIQTANALKQTRDKVIILTGAMKPAAFTNSDAAFNLGSAVIAAQILEPGIYIVMNGRVFDPTRVRKNMNLDRFEDT